MENQHRKITGYRDLTPAEVALMNQIKESAEYVAELVRQLDAAQYVIGQHEHGDLIGTADHRWLAIGRTQLQQGFMALTRAIAKPTTF